MPSVLDADRGAVPTIEIVAISADVTEKEPAARVEPRWAVRPLAAGVVAVLAVGLVAAFLEGTGSDGGQEVVTAAQMEAVSSASARVAELPTYRLEMVVVVEGPVSAETKMSVAVAGDVSRMTTSLPGALPGGRGDFEMIAAGDTVYLPALTGEGWLALRAPMPDGVDPGTLAGSDPLGYLSAITGDEAVAVVGTEEVRGTPTTHYSVTVPWADAIQNAPDGLVDPAVARLSQPPEEIVYDLWLDGDGFVRRLSFEVDSGGMAMSMRIELYDLGAQIDVAVPGPDQIVETREFGAHYEVQQAIGGYLQERLLGG